LWAGAYLGDTVRALLEIVNLDSLRTNDVAYGGVVYDLDSAFLNMMHDTVVGSPGDWTVRQALPITTEQNGRALGHGTVDDGDTCHTDWDHRFAGAEGGAFSCSDTIPNLKRGLDSTDGELNGSDYGVGLIADFTPTQFTTERINISEWIWQIWHEPTADTGGKKSYNGHILVLPTAESYAAASHALVDTLHPSDDGDTTLWGVSPGSAADFNYVDETTPATDSIVTSALTVRTEMFNFPDDTGYGAALLDSMKILIHASTDDATAAGDTCIFIFDTVTALGRARFGKYTPTTSWVTYTSPAIIAPTKVQVANLQAGMIGYHSAGGPTQRGAWVAVRRFFTNTNRRVKFGNVRPLATSTDSTWIDAYYHQGAIEQTARCLLGYTNTQSSDVTLKNQIVCGRFTTPASNVGVVDSLYAYIRTTGTTTARIFRGALYDYNGGTPTRVDTTYQRTITQANINWRGFDFAGSPTLAPSTTYDICMWADNASGTCAIKVTGGQSGYNGDTQLLTFGAYPATLTETDAPGLRVSIYVVYACEAAAGGNGRRRIIQLCD
jgi:hypothetical protein